MHVSVETQSIAKKKEETIQYTHINEMDFFKYIKTHAFHRNIILQCRKSL